MGDKISDYIPDQASNPIKVADLLDISNEDGGGGFDVSKKITVGEMLTFLNANLNTYYNANGTPGEDRTVTMRDASISYDAIFLGGDVVCEMDNGTDDFGFLVKNDSGVVRGTFVYDQAAEGGKITLNTPFGEFFNATDDIVNMGNGALTVNKLTGVVDSRDGYYIEEVNMFTFTKGSNGSIALGELSGNRGTATGTRNLSIGRDSMNVLTSGGSNTAMGWGAGRLISTQSNTIAIGALAMYSNTGADNVAIGTGAITASSSVNRCVAISTSTLSSKTSGTGSIAVGWNAGLSETDGSYNLSFGYQSGVAGAAGISNSIMLGRAAVALSTGQFVVGSDLAAIDEVYLGRGIERTGGTGRETIITTTNQAAGQTDVAANSDLHFIPSIGTGTGVGGDEIHSVAPAGSTGTAQNSLVEVMRLKGDGNINMPNLPTSSAGLASGDIWANSNVLTVVP